MRLLNLLLLLPGALICLEATAQKSIQIVRVEAPPQIDGIVNEDVWKQAALINELYQREPQPGMPVSEKTEVFLCYDNNYLYVGMHCYSAPGGITAKEMARDVSLGEDDRVQIIFDTFLDKRNGYWFQIGPRGSIGDALISQNGANMNKEWDGLWTGKAYIHENGWDAEISIPFKSLSFGKDLNTWGIKIIRHIRRNLESSYWPEANLNSYKFQISDAGLMVGLENILQGIGLDVSPYGLLGWKTKQNATGRSNKITGDAGLDVFYRLTPQLKASLTVNTDFAQTEVDTRQINLTRFSLFFPEKRDFFLDGSNYFSFGSDANTENPYSQRLIPFFSRRVGLDSNGNPVPILWGARITGQAGKWNLGLQHITDDRDSTLGNFSVARISHNIGKQSSVGIIGTYGNANNTSRNGVVGADIHLATSTFNKNKNLDLTLFALKSQTENMSGEDYAYGGSVYYPNDFFSFLGGYHEIGNNFVAGAGFVPRNGIRESYLNAGISPRPDKWGILQVQIMGGIDYITNTNNRMLTRQIDFTPLQIRFKSGEIARFTSSSQFEYLDAPFFIYSKYEIPAGSFNFQKAGISLESAMRRNFWTTLKFSKGTFYNGHRQDFNLAVGYKVMVPLFLGFEYQQNKIDIESGSFTAEILRSNVNILFSPSITLYNFIQYDNFSETLGWQSRFQWIVKPEHEIMLVWNSISRDPLERFVISEGTMNMKMKYVLRF
ncbi:MAG: carbohydrate binding family 9 domain-containing protein [Bacteroidetes bacterium]|nr:carbohydrate binding family 9 domain-containing protein [Bacteroidota bacterium]